MTIKVSADDPLTPKVVDMQRFRTGKCLTPLRQAEAYWSALRDGAGIPKRTQIDPRGLENLLEYAFILECIAPGIARFRLAGRHLTALAGMEVRGMPLTALFTTGARKTVATTLQHLFDTPAIAELTLTSEHRRTSGQISAHVILLPLKCEFDTVSRALGVIVSDAAPGGRPIRFDVSTAMSRPVAGLTYHSNTRDPKALHGFADPAPAGAPLTGAPYLRLVTPSGQTGQ